MDQSRAFLTARRTTGPKGSWNSTCGGFRGGGSEEVFLFAALWEVVGGDLFVFVIPSQFYVCIIEGRF